MMTGEKKNRKKNEQNLFHLCNYVYDKRLQHLKTVPLTHYFVVCLFVFLYSLESIQANNCFKPL